MKTKLLKSVVFALSASTLSASEMSLETAPPVVVRTVPMAGEMNVSESLKEISVTYSKPMQDGSWSWSTWGEENYPQTAGAPHYLNDVRTCVLPVKLKPGAFYAIWLNSQKFHNFTDTNGRPAVPYLLTFRTSGSPEPAQADAGHFGEVREAVLKSPKRRVAELFDLDSGKRDTSTEFGRNDRETHAWIRERSLDVLGVIEKGEISVLCMDMLVPPAPTHSFDIVVAHEVITNRHLLEGEPNKITGISPKQDDTDTFYFRTREGGRGVLQILGPIDEPPGVKIRYKLLVK